MFFIKDFLSGGAAVAISQLVVSPTERVELWLQLHPVSKSRQISKCQGIVGYLGPIPKEDGALSFWLVTDPSPLGLSTLSLKINTSTLSWGLWTREPNSGATCRELASGGATGLPPPALCFVYLDFARTGLAADVGKAGVRGKSESLVTAWFRSPNPVR